MESLSFWNFEKTTEIKSFHVAAPLRRYFSFDDYEIMILGMVFIFDRELYDCLEENVVFYYGVVAQPQHVVVL